MIKYPKKPIKKLKLDEEQDPSALLPGNRTGCGKKLQFNNLKPVLTISCKIYVSKPSKFCRIA